VDVHAIPPKLVALQIELLPKKFEELPPQEHANKFPYGYYDVASLYVATKHRSLNISEIDFVFGGSTLEMLARRDTSNSYLATKIPGTSTILVVKSKNYTQNYADIGFQFERFVTGGSFSSRRDLSFVEHLHVMKVGSYCVLFQAEVDAMMDDEPVEITTAKLRNWGTKKMFQMISSGSPFLCHGVKKGSVLQSATLMPLSEVAHRALQNNNQRQLEENILTAMAELKSNLSKWNEGDVCSVTFDSGKTLCLPPAANTTSVILPSASVTRNLIL
jgi:hypothetical protein